MNARVLSFPDPRWLARVLGSRQHSNLQEVQDAPTRPLANQRMSVPVATLAIDASKVANLGRTSLAIVIPFTHQKL